MRIFVSNADSYVGRALCADLRNVFGQESRLLATASTEADGADQASLEVLQQLGVKRVVSRKDHKQYLQDVFSCSLIVYDLHSADIEEVERVIKHLKLAKLEHETVFVLVSSVNVWARTKKEYVPLAGDGDEDAPEPDEAEAGEAAGAVRKRPKELRDVDLDRRVPSPAYESWKYLETLALSICTKEKLRPHVVAAGVLYGNGETTFNELFKAAWLTQPTHTIISPGDNYIPCVHVRDVARLVKVIVGDPAAGRYLIAVDKARLTQAEIVQGIVNQISNKREVPRVPQEAAEGEFKDTMMLDLIFEPSAPLQAESFPWWCENGLIKNVEKVAAEFCKWRNLRPIKMVVLGPPGSGAERFCSMVAKRYLHEDPPHFTFEQILQDALAKDTPSGAKLREKVEKIRLIPGAKLSLKTRTRLVRARLLSNVCRYRGYVLEGYPSSFEEASALFTELVPETEEQQPAEGEPQEEEEEEEEEEEDAGATKAADDDDEAEPPPPRRTAAAVAPEFAVVLTSAEERCKARIFSGLAAGASTEEEFLRKTRDYRLANLAEDGSPGTSDFFSEVIGVRVLHANVDSNNDDDVFQAIRVYMESRGQFFNYLRSDEELAREREAQLAEEEREADERRAHDEEERRAAEAAAKRQLEESEARRRQLIAENEAIALATETAPLRQYLMNRVVPTLTEGLSEVCKAQPEDPIEFLARFLFAHAQDITRNIPQSQD